MEAKEKYGDYISPENFEKEQANKAAMADKYNIFSLFFRQTFKWINILTRNS